MKSARRTWFPLIFGWLLACMFVVAPSLAAQEAAPDVTDMPVGTIFRWLNFIFVFGGLAYLINKAGGPYFRGHARSISVSIKEATEVRAAAEVELRQVGERLSRLDVEVKELRSTGVRDAAAEAERIRGLTRVEVEKIAQAGRAEVQAAERAGKQELRAIAARLATERAASLVRAGMSAKIEAALFQSFVSELERSAR